MTSPFPRTKSSESVSNRQVALLGEGSRDRLSDQTSSIQVGLKSRVGTDHAVCHEKAIRRLMDACYYQKRGMRWLSLARLLLVI